MRNTRRLMKRRARGPMAAGALGLVLGVGACSPDGPAVRSIGAPRAVEAPAGELQSGPLWNVSAADRFGMRRMSPPAAGPTAGGGVGLAWTTPPGWVEVAPSSMRQANFLAGGDPRAECYLTLLPGDAGGLAANVNRWRKQMSLAPLGADEVDALPRADLFGGSAALLDLEGSFSGMGGAGAEADGYRMLGLLRIDSGGSRFFKLTGPAEVVAHERDAFLALAASFREESASVAAADDPHAGHDHAPGEGHGASQNDAGPRLFVPEGWRAAPERPFRAISFFVGEGEEAECYVSVLNGDGGGLRSNVDRWRSQLGLAAATDEELAQLEHIPMMERDAQIVELVAADGESGMLAAVCFLDDSSLFVKLTGPTAVVEREHDAFIEFCTFLGAPQ